MPDASAPLPIEDYALIGDMHTAALVGKNGSIDWLCLPAFDGPSVFARVLDAEKGGYFQIAPEHGEVTEKQLYWPETNVLTTRFLSEEGVGQVLDFMPVGEHRNGASRVTRVVKAVRGSMTFHLTCRPAFDYARAEHTVEIQRHGARFESETGALTLATEIELEADGGAAVATFTLEEGQTAAFLLSDASETDADVGEDFDACTPDAAEAAFQAAVHYWREWLSNCTYTGRWRETVHRSALALKLMTYAPTGAIVAAPTTSLPEAIGGERNWDYRYTWIRDAAFTLYGLLRIGFTQEARDFMSFLDSLCKDFDGDDHPLQIMYGIDGREALEETDLDHLSGYRDSKPVRVGNGAYDQLQLDIYGELLDAVYLYNKHGAPIGYDLWRALRRFIDWVCEHWEDDDAGIWEVRGGPAAFTYSKLMCWVAIDRGLRLAEKRSFPCDRTAWLEARDAVYESIMAHGYNEELGAFTQCYDGDALDASVLMMPLVFFTSPVDPRMLSTIEAIRKPPSEGGLTTSGLVYRYHPEEAPDGLEGDEGTFNMCTFWLVEALTRAAPADLAYLEDARLMFEQMLGHANHVGLYAEETGHHGEALGNFPQAFTHLGLISAAYNLDKALG